MIDTNLLFLLMVGSVVAAAAGYLGSFMVLKRMSLVGDALSHVALPGMAIGLAFHFSPILGALVALILATVGIWYFQQNSTIYSEALVGIFFTASLALGFLITPEPDLLEALFGNLEKMSLFEGMLATLCALLILIAVRRIANSLLLGIISEDLAKSVGIKISTLNLIYLLLVGMIVALGVKFVGTLLMGALVIVPAASAKNISGGIHRYHLLSALFGVVSALVGIVLSQALHTTVGPVVVLVSILIFIISYIFK